MKKSNFKDDMSQDKKLIKKAFGMHDKQEHKGEHTDLTKLKQGGNTMKRKKMNPALMAAMMAPKMAAPKMAAPMAAAAPMAPAGIPGMKKGGKAKCMASGGMPMVEKNGKQVPAFAADGVGKMAKGGCMAKGGSASSRADGIATKGKTKGKFC
jgi:hypothetical protein